MAFKQIYRGMENGAETIDENFTAAEKMFDDQKEAMAITTISGNQGEVTDVPLNETRFGFGSEVRTTGTQPVFSVGSDHFAVCQIAGTYLIDIQMNVQFAKEINGWNYIEIEVNGSTRGAFFTHGANTMRNKWYSSSLVMLTLKAGDKLNFLSTCSDTSAGLATSLRCPLATFRRIGD